MKACRGLLAAAFAAACTREIVEPALPVLVLPDTVMVQEADSVMVNVVIIDSSGAALQDVPLAWAIADTSIASVNPHGMVTWRQAGTTSLAVLARGQTHVVPVRATARFGVYAVGGGERWCGMTTRGRWYCERADTLRTITWPALPVAQLTAYWTRYCAVLQDARGFCWGNNDVFAGLGFTANPGWNDPAEIAGGLRYQRIMAGQYSTCGVTTGGTAWCWGDGRSGALGQGSFQSSRTAPVAVTGGHTFTDIGVGMGYACALDTAGAAWCWGDNWQGTLGIAADSPFASPTPLRVSGNHVFTAIAVGTLHACGLEADGTAWCWGSNERGNLGTGTARSNAPVKFGTGYRAIAVGGTPTCGLLQDGRIRCAGIQETATIVNGVPTFPLVDITGLPPLVSLEPDGHGACGRDAQQRIWCWGPVFGDAHPIPSQP